MATWSTIRGWFESGRPPLKKSDPGVSGVGWGEGGQIGGNLFSY